MKLSKAESNWVKQLVEDSTSKERETLKRKEKAISGFASALMSWRESTEMVRQAWAEYKAETGEGRKSVSARLHISNAEQNIVMSSSAGIHGEHQASSTESQSQADEIRLS